MQSTHLFRVIIISICTECHVSFHFRLCWMPLDDHCAVTFTYRSYYCTWLQNGRQLQKDCHCKCNIVGCAGVNRLLLFCLQFKLLHTQGNSAVETSHQSSSSSPSQSILYNHIGRTDYEQICSKINNN